MLYFLPHFILGFICIVGQDTKKLRLPQKKFRGSRNLIKISTGS